MSEISVISIIALIVSIIGLTISLAFLRWALKQSKEIDKMIERHNK